MATQPHAASNTMIITGGNAGLGYECARAVAANPDWHVVLACRDAARATGAVERLRTESGSARVEALPLDLASLASVRRFAADFAARDLPPLRAIVCNAGLQVVSGTTYTEDGFETTFGVNHLGHFLLVNLLLGELVAPAPIVFVSSGTHDPAQRTGMPAPRYRDARALAFPDRYPDPSAVGESPGAIGRRRYTTSKLCNILCAYELDRRLRVADHGATGRPIAVDIFDPGLMPWSGLARDYGRAQRLIWRAVMPALRLVVPNVNSPAASGVALARLATDPALEGVSGRYFEGRREIPSSEESYDERKAAELWEGSAGLVGLAPDETTIRPRASLANV